MKGLLLFLLCLPIVLGFDSDQIKPLIRNGTFDGEPSYKGWEKRFGVISKTSGGNPDGYVWLNDSGGAEDPSISQQIKNLQINRVYIIKGHYRGGDHAILKYNYPGRIVFAVDVDDKTLATFRLPEPDITRWTSFEAVFTATANSHQIRFRAEINGTDGDIALDNILIEEQIID